MANGRPRKSIRQRILSAANRYDTVTTSKLRSYLGMSKSEVSDEQFKSSVVAQAYQLVSEGKLSRVAPKTFSITNEGRFAIKN